MKSQSWWLSGEDVEGRGLGNLAQAFFITSEFTISWILFAFLYEIQYTGDEKYQEVQDGN